MADEIKDGGTADTKPADSTTTTTPGDTKPGDGGGADTTTTTDDKSKAPNDTKEPTGTTDGDPPAPKAPEKYELVVPEGDRIDPDDVKAIEDLARANAWSNEQAQAELTAYHEALVAQSDRFLTVTKADPVYGGDNLAETQRLANSVIAFVRPQDHPRAAAFMKTLTKGGYLNHIEVVSFLADLGKQMAEDKPLHGRDGGDNKPKKSAAEVLYGKP